MFLLVDKDKGITSHDVVNKIRKITGEKRVGHAGTLDPNASGLLIVAVGRDSTKDLWKKYGNLKKTYIAEITLGEERETDDAEGNFIYKSDNTKVFKKEDIVKVLNGFVGEKMQMPPLYSAIKIKGKKAYDLARRGINLSLSPRKVHIYSIKLIKYHHPLLEIEVIVSSGTYVRALARDIGKKLGCGAYLSNLRRTKIGKFKVENSIEVNKLNRVNIKNCVLS